jgi:hypothetical protein
MRDRGLIVLGLVVAIGLLTFPIWYDSARGISSEAPELKPAVEGETCIYPTEYMRESHMNVLMDWRDRVVRQDERMVNINGHEWEMSLTRTCMECHDSKEQFCDQCHNYAAVNVYCWDCHVAPEAATFAEVQR